MDNEQWYRVTFYPEWDSSKKIDDFKYSKPMTIEAKLLSNPPYFGFQNEDGLYQIYYKAITVMIPIVKDSL